jgi:ABC-2 type transport system ATP-binding protein
MMTGASGTGVKHGLPISSEPHDLTHKQRFEAEMLSALQGNTLPSSSDVSRRRAPITVSKLIKRYGKETIINGVDLEVQAGEIFGLLGPNGAGKTTLIEILEGLRSRTSGDVSVLGLDPEHHARALRERVGVALQATSFHDVMRVREVLELYGSIYADPVPTSTLLQQFQLVEKRDSRISLLSGGQRQRLTLALAVINRPQLLFLDEPTAGLDPHARHDIYAIVSTLRAEGITIFLTTHYLEEAERLCDRVAILDKGVIRLVGSPKDIRAQGNSETEITAMLSAEPTRAVYALLKEYVTSYFAAGRTIHLQTMQPGVCITELVSALTREGICLLDMRIERPTLEDAFIQLTQRGEDQ